MLSRAKRSPTPNAYGVEHHHRDLTGGGARAAVFGLSDGLTTNISLILGVAGAHPAQGFVRLAGLAGLIAGAVSMASGEYVSVKAQAELFERELETERIEIARRPDSERRELAGLYRSRGVEPGLADDMARELMRDPDLALETHAREELGIQPGSFGSPVQAAVSSFVSFAIGAAMPLIPWFFTRGNLGVGLSVLLAALSALTVGGLLARFTGRSVLRSAARQLAIVAIAAAFTYAIGRAVGIGTA
jgi:VIT1/CCC1 family predicted Fe2+/Mn2+ transporter